MNGSRLMTRQQTVAFLAAWFVCGSAALSLAADPPLSAFASDADVVIRLKAPQQTIERAAAMAATADETIAMQIRQNSLIIGALISNPALAGVDQAQDWLVVVHARPEADPAVIFCIPATDAAAMQAAVSKKMKSFARDGWVFYSEDADAIAGLQKAPLTSTTSIASKIDGEAKAVFDRGDISIFLNVDHLSEVYKEQLEDGSSNLAKQLNRQAGVLNMVPGADVGSVLNGGAAAGRELVKDTRAFTTAIVFNRTGLNFETLGQFKDGSKTALAMDGHPGNPLASIAKLPDAGVFYLGVSSSLSQGFQDKVMSVGQSADATDEQQEQADELKQMLAGVTYQSFAVALGLGHREQGVLRVASITEASPTDKIRDFSAAAAEVSNVDLAGQGIKQEARYERDAETAGSQPIDVMTVTTTVDPSVNPFQGQMLVRAINFLFGPRGIENRFAYFGDKYLYTLGGGPEAMEDAVEALEGSALNVTPVFREELLPEPNVLVLLDLQRIAYRALNAAAQSPELNLPVDASIIAKEEPKPSYIGFTIAAEPAALHSKTQIPADQIATIAKLVITYRTLSGRQRNR